MPVECNDRFMVALWLPWLVGACQSDRTVRKSCTRYILARKLETQPVPWGGNMVAQSLGDQSTERL